MNPYDKYLQYMGLRRERERGPAYDELIQEFFDACHDKYGRQVLIQFEDFGNTTAFELLAKFQPKACTFNDDIQGTASVTTAGVISSLPLCNKKKVGRATAYSYYLYILRHSRINLLAITNYNRFLSTLSCSTERAKLVSASPICLPWPSRLIVDAPSRRLSRESGSSTLTVL
jgi:Malic enzyme, N-terminal domain